jgi:hypothetical protein
VFETAATMFEESTDFGPLCLEMFGDYSTFGAVAAGLQGRFILTYREDVTTLVLEAPGESNGTATESSGTATIEADGTIVLNLVASGDGITGHGVFEYPPDHPDYPMILDHLGGLEPGQTKPVPPFPDE